jgi:hypothetical protein
MSSNSGTGIHRLLPQNFFGSVNDFLTKNKTLDFFINRGTNDIPYGFMAISTAAVGAFTYVTYTDYADEIASGISETLDSIQSTELFNSSTDEDNPFELNIPDMNNPDMNNPDQEPQDIIFGENSNVDTNTPKENDNIIEQKEEKKEESKDEKKEDEKKEDENKEESKDEKEKKKEEPGEQFTMGGKKKRKSKRRKTYKKKKKSQN